MYYDRRHPRSGMITNTGTTLMLIIIILSVSCDVRIDQLRGEHDASL